MTTEHDPVNLPDNLPDTDLITLFAGVQPAAGFEDRLITAVRRHRRLRLVIPPAVQRSAIAAAAVLAVGSIGYLGSQAMNGQLRFARDAVNRDRPASNLHQMGLAITENGQRPHFADPDVVDKSSTNSGWWGWPDSTTDPAVSNGKPNLLKPDVDMIGGTSLKYHVPNSDDPFLAERTTDALKKRVDPVGERNYIWNGTGGQAVAGNGIADADSKKAGKQPFAPLTDSEGYALKIGGNNAPPPTSTLVAAIVADINNGTGPGTAATTVSPAKLYSDLDSILLPSASQSGDGVAHTTFPPTVKNYVLGTNGQPLDTGAQIGSGGINGAAYQRDPNAVNTNTITGNVAGLNYFHGSSNNEIRVSGGTLSVGSTAGQQPGGQTPTTPAGGTSITGENVAGLQFGYFNVLPKQADGLTPGSGANTTGSTNGEIPMYVYATVAEPKTPPPSSPSVSSDTAAIALQMAQAKADAEKGGQSPKPVAMDPLAPREALVPIVDSRNDTGPLPTATAPGGGNAKPAPAPVIDDRKIIRTGSMEFDVDRFDTAQMQITKIVLELGGFVGATDSQKLPNGKVRGSIAVRVPPERLDVLVLSLRALGDLKSQQITAADITKEYTDVQSELAADRAMQDRLLELIHDGKGTVKDLLAAENELGEWRTKIEKAEGMIRYYNGQVALSTLTITLTERDIQTPATAVETETADVGIEAEDVEKARNSALKAIDDVKGRIVEAELKRFDAGQLAARLVADVPPESAGAVIDQLKQLGKVARLEIHRQETNSNGAAASGAAPLHTERKPTRLLISIYNLANVAPRRTTNVSLAGADVEAAYTALVAATKSSGGRVVTSNLDRGDPNKATGALVLEFPPDKFDAAMATLHAQGEVLNLSSTENPDTQNSTEAKAGLTVKLISLANVAPRHTTNVALAAGDVNAAYAALIAITKSSGGRVVTSNLEQGDPLKANGSLVLELPPEKFDAAMTTLHAQGDVLKFNLMENADTQNSTEAKQGLTVRLIALAAIAPREIVQQTLAAPDVPTAYQAILSAASSTKSRIQSASLNEQDRQNITADIQVEVPRAEIADFDKALNAAGGTIARTSGRSADAENTVDSKVQVKLSVISADHLAPRETTKLQVEVSDVDKSANDAQAAAIAAGGRVLESTISKDHGKGIARIILDFPLDKSADLLNQIRSAGTVRGIDASRDQQAPSGPLAHGQIYVEFRTTEAIVADQTGPWASVRSGLSTSVNGLLWSLQWVVVGLCLIGPWALVGWVGWKFWKRRRPATP